MQCVPPSNNRKETLQKTIWIWILLTICLLFFVGMFFCGQTSKVDSELLNHLFALWDSRPENRLAPFHAPGSGYSAIVGSELFRSFGVLSGVCDIGFYNIKSRNGQNIYTLYHISIIILSYLLRCQLMKPLDGSWDISMTVPLCLQKRPFESYEIPRIRCY